MELGEEREEAEEEKVEEEEEAEKRKKQSSEAVIQVHHLNQFPPQAQARCPARRLLPPSPPEDLH